MTGRIAGIHDFAPSVFHPGQSIEKTGALAVAATVEGDDIETESNSRQTLRELGRTIFTTYNDPEQA